MKLLIMPNSSKQARELLHKTNGIIIGVDKLCINMPFNFSLEGAIELIKLYRENDKDVFLSLNKNMHDEDLPYLKEVLIKVDDLGLTGIMYYDIAIVNLKEEMNIKTDLVWAQEHLTTNYLTSEFWYLFGAKYVLLSSEITLDEVNEIADNSSAKTILPIFGHLPMFVSKRTLVKSYLETFNLHDDSEINYLEKEGKIYPIIDGRDGTIAYSPYVINGIEEMLKAKVDYVSLDSFGISDDDFEKVLDMFNSVDSSNVLEYNNKINSMFETSKGFLYNETIYRVKKDGKN